MEENNNNKMIFSKYKENKEIENISLYVTYLQLTSKYQEPITTLANNFLSSSEMFSIANISGSI